MTEITFTEETLSVAGTSAGYDVLTSSRRRKTTEGQDRYQSSAPKVQAGQSGIKSINAYRLVQHHVDFFSRRQ